MMGFPGAEQCHDLTLSRLESLYVRCLGAPANGLRIRLRHVLPQTAGTFDRILDAGSGVGVMTMELAKSHPEARVVGLELDPAAVQRANAIVTRAGLGNCQFVQGDVTELDADQEFDLALSVDSLEHVEADALALTRLFQALVPGGRLVLHTPNYYRRWPVWRRQINFNVPGHVRPGYHLDDLRGLVEATGFRVLKIRYTFGFIENLTNNISYAVTGADRRNRHLYATIFPLLLAGSWIGQWARPSWGAGLLVVAQRPVEARVPISAKFRRGQDAPT